jgi:hypothetical protein
VQLAADEDEMEGVAPPPALPFRFPCHKEGIIGFGCRNKMQKPKQKLTARTACAQVEAGAREGAEAQPRKVLTVKYARMLRWLQASARCAPGWFWSTTPCF